MTATDRHGGDREASGRAEARLRRLASTSGSLTFSALDAPPSRVRSSGLDDKTDALVRLAALVAVGASATSYRCTVAAALDRGASVDEVIGTMIAVAPTVGLSRLVSAIVGLALAMGYDIDAALECLDLPANQSQQPWCQG